MSYHAKTHTHKNGRTYTHTHTQRDSNEYPIVAFSKNATIIKVFETAKATDIFVKNINLGRPILPEAETTQSTPLQTTVAANRIVTLRWHTTVTVDFHTEPQDYNPHQTTVNKESIEHHPNGLTSSTIIVLGTVAAVVLLALCLTTVAVVLYFFRKK